MKFNPKSDAEIAKEQAARGPKPRGIYDAEIKTAEETTSKAGNDMIALELNVYDNEGNVFQVRDWLLELIPGKLRNCMKACGLSTQYENGTLDAWMLEGKPVRVKLGIDTKGEYPRNKLDDYVPSEAAAPAAPPAPARQAARPTAATPARASAVVDDEIPF